MDFPVRRANARRRWRIGQEEPVLRGLGLPGRPMRRECRHGNPPSVGGPKRAMTRSWAAGRTPSSFSARVAGPPDRRSVAFEGGKVETVPRDDPIPILDYDVLDRVDGVAPWRRRRAGRIVGVQARPPLVVEPVTDRHGDEGTGGREDGDRAMAARGVAELKAI